MYRCQVCSRSNCGVGTISGGSRSILNVVRCVCRWTDIVNDRIRRPERDVGRNNVYPWRARAPTVVGKRVNRFVGEPMPCGRRERTLCRG